MLSLIFLIAFIRFVAFEFAIAISIAFRDSDWGVKIAGSVLLLIMIAIIFFLLFLMVKYPLWPIILK